MLHVPLVARTATDMKIIMFKVNITLTVTRVVETDRQTQSSKEKERGREIERQSKEEKHTYASYKCRTCVCFGFAGLVCVFSNIL